MPQQIEKAANEVGQLYALDTIARELDTGEDANRGPAWSELAEEFPEFSEQIQALNKALTLAYAKKIGNPLLNSATEKPFEMVSDVVTKSLLGDILCGRLIMPPNTFDATVDMDDEAKQMATELAIPEGWSNPQAKSLTPKTIFKAVLSGTLRITHA